VVFHAAAHKHLPLLERYPVEGVKTNILGTANVVAAAARCGTERFVNVSTDKAAAPTSMLGATKRLAEMVSASWAGDTMKIASVRFGNVLGSRGSFLPTLAWQIRNGLPVTVTDPRVTRFFMTIPEAASLVIEVAAMAETGETYVLDMGEPVRIVDLIAQYVDRVGGIRPELVYTGLRPGEKLHEELVDGQESRGDTGDPRIWCLTARQPIDPELRDQVEELDQLVSYLRADELRDRVWALLAGVSTLSAPMGDEFGNQVTPDARAANQVPA
jgi:FlaA1/EpsC-like NDP-sugar epimerase